MSLKRYRLRAKRIKITPKHEWVMMGNVRYLMSKIGQRKLVRRGSSVYSKISGDTAQFIYLPPISGEPLMIDVQHTDEYIYTMAPVPRINITNDQWIYNMRSEGDIKCNIAIDAK